MSAGLKCRRKVPEEKYGREEKYCEKYPAKSRGKYREERRFSAA